MPATDFPQPELLSDPFDVMPQISRESTITVAEQRTAEVSDVEANSQLTPRPQEKTPAEVTEDILSSSAHGIDMGVKTFMSVGRRDTLSQPNSRYGEDTPGGTALGDTEHRTRISNDPELLRPAIKARLEKIISISADSQEKAKTSAKNKHDAERGFWRVGDFIHSTDYTSLSAILETGLLSSEFHGAKAKTDTTPLAADFSEIIEPVGSLEEATSNKSSSYSADRGGDTSIMIRFRREVGSTDYGEDSTGNLDESPGHRTVFVGVPSTEIAGVQIVGKDVDVEKIISNIISNGEYIPVYDTNDQLLLTPEEFELVSGIEIVSLDSARLIDSDVEDSKLQIVRMANRLYKLGNASSHKGHSEQFSVSQKRGNAKHSHYVDTEEGAPIYLNAEDSEIGKPKPNARVTVELDESRRLHVIENDDGEIDMFISQLDGDAVSVTGDILPELRKDLAKVFSVNRYRMALQRIQNKEIEKKKEEEAEIDW